MPGIYVKEIAVMGIFVAACIMQERGIVVIVNIFLYVFVRVCAIFVFGGQDAQVIYVNEFALRACMAFALDEIEQCRQGIFRFATITVAIACFRGNIFGFVPGKVA